MTDIKEQLQSLLSETPAQRLLSLKAKISDSLKPPEGSPEPQPFPDEPPQVHVPTEVGAPSVQRHLVYFAYNFNSAAPSWVDPLRTALRGQGYLAFSPFEAVEQQYEPDEKAPLLELRTRLLSAVCAFLKQPETLLLPLDNSAVIASLRQGDAKQDVDTLLFKDLYFLSRSSLVLADLIKEPYTPDLIQKLFYARLLDIPVVGIGPSGYPLNAFMQKLVKVVLTDEFNVANVMPLVRGYSA